jgi:hypothetical protein
VGAGEIVIREIMIRWIDKHSKRAAHSWSMKNLTWRKIQEGPEPELIDVGIADRLGKSENVEVVDLAEATGSAVFVPEYWWTNRKKDWKERTHTLPGLEKHQRTMRLGWNRKVAERRPEVAKLVEMLGARRR